MINRRLKAIADFVPRGSVVLDVGTDHALLPIYLVKEKICPKVLASDISKKAIESAKENIQKYAASNITLYVTDGLQDISEKYDVITISGMGTNTILEILDKNDLPNIIILSPNNHLELLRKAMNKKGYMIKSEKVIYEKKKYYDILLYVKGKEKLSFFETIYGKSSNLEYLNHLYKEGKKIYGVAPFKKKIKMMPYMHMLKKFIEKKMDN